jgi:hypothetical protein
MIFIVTYYSSNHRGSWVLDFECNTLKINDILANAKKQWDALIVDENNLIIGEDGGDRLYTPMPIDRNQLIITDIMGNVFKDSDVYMYNFIYKRYTDGEVDEIRMSIYEGKFFNFHEFCFHHNMGYISKMNPDDKYEYVFVYTDPEIVRDDVMLAIKRDYLKQMHERINGAGGNITKIMNAKQPDFDARLISQLVHNFLVGDTKRARTEEESGICLIT